MEASFSQFAIIYKHIADGLELVCTDDGERMFVFCQRSDFSLSSILDELERTSQPMSRADLVTAIARFPRARGHRPMQLRGELPAASVYPGEIVRITQSPTEWLEAIKLDRSDTYWVTKHCTSGPSVQGRHVRIPRLRILADADYARIRPERIEFLSRDISGAYLDATLCRGLCNTEVADSIEDLVYDLRQMTPVDDGAAIPAATLKRMAAMAQRAGLGFATLWHILDSIANNPLD